MARMDRRVGVSAALLTGVLVFGLAAPSWGIPLRPSVEQTPADAETDPTAPPESGDADAPTPEPTEDPSTDADGTADGTESDVDADASIEGPEANADATAEDEPEPTEEPAPTEEPEPTDEADAELPELLASPLSVTLRGEMAALGSLADQRNGRLAGADRYATAVAVSKHAYSRADTVIVATGLDFPDSLSAAPLAAKLRAPLLLTQPGGLPAATRSEIQRLKPKTIIIVGGTGAVSSAVQRSLNGLAGKVERISGKDRYATSVAVSKRGWTKTAPSAFIATGRDYADALAAGAAAGRLGVPVILVPGNASTAPAVLRSEITRLKPSRIYIAGGTGVVTSAMQKSIANGRAVTRYAGADRYETSARISDGIFSGASRGTYLAYGLGFADALTGAAAAGVEGSPLLLARDTCIPTTVYAASDRRNPNRTFLLGGTGVLTNGVRNGNECMRKPSGISNASWSGTQKLYARINQERYSAGLAAARLADGPRGTPAYSWANRKTVAFNNSLKSQQPWVRYEGTGRSSTKNDRVAGAYSHFTKDAKAKKWILRKTNGSRTFVSIGFASANPYSYATIYVGTGLK